MDQGECQVVEDEVQLGVVSLLQVFEQDVVEQQFFVGGGEDDCKQYQEQWEVSDCVLYQFYVGGYWFDVELFGKEGDVVVVEYDQCGYQQGLVLGGWLQ